MKKILLLIFYIINIYVNPLSGLEIDVTEGKIEPLPIAVVKFNSQDATEEDYSLKINTIISNNLRNTGLFKILSEKSFLQSENEVFLQPLFSDWRLIDANFLISGEIFINNRLLKINFKLWDIYQEKLVVNKNISGISESDWRTSSHIISNIIYENITGEKGYFDTKVVYVAEEGDGAEKSRKLAIMDYDGNNHKILTDGKDLVLTPRFSPDGKNIVFLQYKNNKASVYLMNLKSKNTKILGNYLGMSFAPRFSPDGKKIIFSLTSRGQSNIFIQDLEKNKNFQVTNNKYINTSPYFSPNGKKIVFSSDRAGKQNLYIKKVVNNFKKAERITYGKGNYATPVWSPRGDYIAFTKSYKKKFYIGLIKANGKGERLISEGYLADGPTWSPNGRTLAFYKIVKDQNNQNKSKLFTIDITGNLEKELVTPYQASDPDWGPSIKY
ncbi:MAG: Protein TolB [Alphaproteobacteria bacterium MarineAlpha9_Bin4]|nr:MAG: Protein TolB [Alphaproteobacteria bacterium MarineAlpha9_Bin4]|tara:strand:+ start:267 stop:1586 length:1320 start_codon:yes stop_codon:yes gene_type:complete